MGNYFAYMRVSTNQDRQSFARQEKALERYAKENNIEYLLVFREEKSAKDFGRPQFSKLEKLLQNGDTVVFKDLSRFTREAVNGYEKYVEWMSKGVNIVFLDNPTVSTDYIAALTSTAAEQDLITRTAMEGVIKLLLIVELDRAEQQRKYIVKAIKDGMAASGKKSGRTAGKLDKMTDTLRDDLMAYLADKNAKLAPILRKHKISRNTGVKYAEIVKAEMDESRMVAHVTDGDAQNILAPASAVR